MRGTGRLAGGGFQSLGRDSVLSDQRGTMDAAAVLVFQSLGRDSVLSDFFFHNLVSLSIKRFNPSVGILCFQTLAPFV